MHGKILIAGAGAGAGGLVRNSYFLTSTAEHLKTLNFKL